MHSAESTSPYVINAFDRTVIFPLLGLNAVPTGQRGVTFPNEARDAASAPLFVAREAAICFARLVTS
ncbi:hypothetical protein ACHAXM_008757 [Skeletonema potamos]